MAATDFGSLPAARKKVWAMEMFRHARDQSFWNRNGFIGSGTSDMTRPVHRITELTRTERGDVCIMQLVNDLVGDGVVGDNLMEGNEEALYNDAIEIRLDQLRNGVRNKGRMAEQRVVQRFRAVARDKLGFWRADKLDELMFLTASGVAYTQKLDGTTRAASQLPSLAFASDVAAPSTKRIMYAGSATSTGTLTANDKMSWDLIVRARALADRRYIKPLRMGGKEYYCILMSTEQERDLKRDNTYQTLVAKAHVRGPDNPLFNNALAVVDGTILYSHRKTYNTLGLASGSKWGAGGAIDGAQALLLGAQALGYASLGMPEYEESDNTDYNNRPGISIGSIMGLVKPQFITTHTGGTREDFGVVSIYTAASAT